MWYCGQGGGEGVKYLTQPADSVPPPPGRRFSFAGEQAAAALLRVTGRERPSDIRLLKVPQNEQAFRSLVWLPAAIVEKTTTSTPELLPLSQLPV